MKIRVFYILIELFIHCYSYQVRNDNNKNILDLQRLIEENAKLDREISMLKLKNKHPSISPPKFLQIEKEIPKIECIHKEGMLKIRDKDQNDKDVSVTFAILTKDRLSYFINPKDETSIQGSIELSKIKGNIKFINGFPTCFTIKTIDDVSDCTICAESEDKSQEWINAITQNSVNCIN